MRATAVDSSTASLREGRVEARRVVGRLPGVQDDYQTVLVPACRVQPVVPALERWHDLLEEADVGVGLVQDPHRRREDRRLRDPARRDLGGAVAGGGAPELGAGRVVGIRNVEDDVWDHSVLPLAAKERTHLGSPTRRVDACEADRDQRRVPVPLVRVEVATGPDEGAHVVAGQDGTGLLDQRSSVPRSSWPSLAHSVRPLRPQRQPARVLPPPDDR